MRLNKDVDRLALIKLNSEITVYSERGISGALLLNTRRLAGVQWERGKYFADMRLKLTSVLADPHNWHLDNIP